MKIFLTSDLHFGHDRGFIYKPRIFNSIEEHDATIIENWNSIVSDEDQVYILGDIIMGDQDAGIDKVSQLNGKKTIIRGNHDTDAKLEKYCQIIDTPILWSDIIKYKKWHFYLSHYPTITSYMEKGEPIKNHLINLYGHTHSKDKFYNDIPFMYNVALDAHNNKPVEIEEIIADIKAKVEECKQYL